MVPLGTTTSAVLLRLPCANRPNEGGPPGIPVTAGAPALTFSGMPAKAMVLVGVTLFTVEPETDTCSIMAPTATLLSSAAQKDPQCFSALKPICGPMKSLRIANEPEPAEELLKSTGGGRPSPGWKVRENKESTLAVSFSFRAT